MAKKTKVAAPVMRLFKVVQSDGSAPYRTEYKWSLPTKGSDGAWVPGSWHEEKAVRASSRGLHVTPCPNRHMPYGDTIVCEAECEGIVGNPDVDSQVVAGRVRLVRILDEHEVNTVSDAWEAQVHVARRREENRERLDKARAVSRLAVAETAAARAAGVESPAMLAFKTLIELTPTESWRDANVSRREALGYVTKWLRMDPDDVKNILHRYDGSYWLGENGAESMYADAVLSGNKSACVAWESYMGRKPWWTTGHNGKKHRVVVGTAVRVDDAWHTINSFRDEYVNTRRQSDKKLVKLTREQVLQGKSSQ